VLQQKVQENRNEHSAASQAQIDTIIKRTVRPDSLPRNTLVNKTTKRQKCLQML